MAENGGDAEELPVTVDNAITTAYYTRAFNLPDTVRARAQTAFSIATVIATGLLAAGVFSNFSDSSTGFHHGGIGVLGLWLIASALSIRAATMSYKDPGQGESAESGLPWVKHVTNSSLEERGKVLWWQRAGTWASFAALAATVVLVGWWLASPSYATVRAQLVLTRDGQAAYAQLCGARTSVVDARVRSKTLDADQVVLTPIQPPCHANGETIELPREAIAATATP
jgi:hypothetical protein